VTTIIIIALGAYLIFVAGMFVLGLVMRFPVPLFLPLIMLFMVVKPSVKQEPSGKSRIIAVDGVPAVAPLH
jgi:hypothetical protein